MRVGSARVVRGEHQARASVNPSGSGRSTQLSTATIIIGLVFGLLALAPGPANATSLCSSRSLGVVAHQDDDLLFLAPDLAHDIRAGGCVREVYVTAGDAGMDQTLAGREVVKAALASYAGVASHWTTKTLSTSGGTAKLATLSAHPQVTAIFLRLPDGFQNGQTSGDGVGGHYESLRHLWENPSLTGATVDGAAHYNRQSLIATLRKITVGFKPDVIRIQNPVGYPELNDGANDHSDHSDHHLSARFETAAAIAAGVGDRLVTYLDYEIGFLPPNVGPADYRVKKKAMWAYARHDSQACNAPCTTWTDVHEAYRDWMFRQYHPSDFWPTTAIVAYGGTKCLGIIGNGYNPRVLPGGWRATRPASAAADGVWADPGGLLCRDPAGQRAPFLQKGRTVAVAR